MKKIYVVYRYGYEYCIALQAYSKEENAEKVKKQCEDYEKNTPYIDNISLENSSENDIDAIIKNLESWKSNHPLNQEPAEIGYIVKPLMLAE